MPEPTTYSITVTIEGKTLDTIRKDDQKVLALVRDIGLGSKTANGNIVFATFPSAELAATQTFTWKEAYNVCETLTKFAPNGTITVGTDKVDVLRGQSVTFDENSHGKAVGEFQPTGSITVVNDWKNEASVVVGCKSKNADGVEETVPHYISAPRTLQDRSALTPVQSFSVLVSSSLKTKTMIDVTEGVRGHFEINQGKNECTVHYDTYSGSNQWTSVNNATKIG